MHLFPQDLGDKRSRTLFFRRAGRSQDSLPSEPTPVGWWGRRWLGRPKGELAPDAATVSLIAVRHPARFWVGLGLLPIPLAPVILVTSQQSGSPMDILGPVLIATWAWLLAGVVPKTLLTRKLSQVQDQPLSAAEIAALLPLAHDELERSYLTLVMDVARQDVSATACANLRPALRALGEAIDRLPATRAVGADSPDIMTEVLRRVATESLHHAQAEPDRVVAASLVRRAEALQRRADATTRAALLTRRFSALRQEMAAETEALRAGLAAYYTGAHDVADLTQLAEDVRRVAAEAEAMTAASEEVDALLTGGALNAPTASTEARLQLGMG